MPTLSTLRPVNGYVPNFLVRGLRIPKEIARAGGIHYYLKVVPKPDGECLASTFTEMLIAMGIKTKYTVTSLTKFAWEHHQARNRRNSNLSEVSFFPTWLLMQYGLKESVSTPIGINQLFSQSNPFTSKLEQPGIFVLNFSNDSFAHVIMIRIVRESKNRNNLTYAIFDSNLHRNINANVIQPERYIVNGNWAIARDIHSFYRAFNDIFLIETGLAQEKSGQKYSDVRIIEWKKQE